VGKVMHYLSTSEPYITNEKARKIIGNPDTAKVLKRLRRLVEQGL
jgi:hypothetical protein